jgi:predicted ribosomally synthesized peptide with nif11-like leader
MESALVFMQSVAKDAQLQARLAAAPNPAAYANIAAELGYRVSTEEMERALGIDEDLTEERLAPSLADACSWCHFCSRLAARSGDVV